MKNRNGRWQLLFAAALAGGLTAPCWSATDCPASRISAQASETLLDAHPQLFQTLKLLAEKALRNRTPPPTHLHSAGVTNKQDPQLLASRAAFLQADETSVTAIAYRVFGDERYLGYTHWSLQQWAERNIPTGHPIDETRLESLIWAYVLTCPQMPAAESTPIRQYFERMRMAKRNWQFGPKTDFNNHKTHQLKMLILLDHVLQDNAALATDIAAARAHSQHNLLASGASYDYLDRDSLFYHVFNLEAWLEIQLASGCCNNAVAAAFWFSARKLLSDDIHGEFVHSDAPIDKKRAAAGFGYAKTNGSYNPKKAYRSVQVFETLYPQQSLPRELLAMVKTSKPSPAAAFYTVRRLLWKA